MSLHIEHIHIHNFRSCADTSLRLGPCTPIVGYNNAGKSNILDALSFAVSPARLLERDFFDGKHPVVIEVTIRGVTDAVLDGLGSAHRTKVEPFCEGETLTVRRTSAAPGTTAANVKTDLLDPRTGEWAPNPAGISNALKALFPDPIRIRAMEDAGADASKTGSTSLGQLIKELLSEFDELLRSHVSEALDEISSVFRATSDTRPNVFEEADAEISESLGVLIPNLRAHLDVTAPTFDDLITKGATILISEEGQDPRRVNEFGHGTQRMTQMALVQLLAKRKHREGAVRPLLLIDEPELYLHPQAIEAIKRSLQQLSRVGYQVVFSTHTPVLVGRDAYHLAAVATKDAGRTSVRRSIQEAVELAVEDASRNEALFAFRNAASLFFSDRVLVVEGKDDKACFEELYSMDRDRDLSDLGVGVIDLGGVGNAPKLWDVLQAMRVPFLLVADLDFAFRTGPKILANTSVHEAHSDDVASCGSVFERLKASGVEIELDENGIPTKAGAVKPNEAFALLARDEAGKQIIGRIHSRLREIGIWVWPCGALEQLLGEHGHKRRSIMRENALAAASERGIDEAIAESSLLRSLFDAAEDRTCFAGSTPVADVSIGGIRFVADQ